MNILDTIKPIKLLAGSHKNTSETGSGCFLNVASYLAGDTEITDRPTCVSPVLRGFVIKVNDMLPPQLRQELLPFVHRAMQTGNEGALYECFAVRVQGEFAQDALHLLASWAAHDPRVLGGHHHGQRAYYGGAPNYFGPQPFATFKVDLQMLWENMRDWRDNPMRQVDEVLEVIHRLNAERNGPRSLFEMGRYRRQQAVFTTLDAKEEHIPAPTRITFGEEFTQLVTHTLDRMLPQDTPPAPEVIVRAEQLVATYTGHKAKVVA